MLITAKRFAIMVLGAAAPILLVLLDPSATARIVLPIWLFAFLLFGWHLTGIIRNSEENYVREEVLKQVSIQFSAAGSNEQIFEVAKQAAVTLLPNKDVDSVASVLALENKVWKTVASTQSSVAEIRNQWRIEEVLTEIRNMPEGAEIEMRRRQELRVADRVTVFIPLISLNEVRGAIVVESTRQLPQTIIETFSTVATQVALALEASELSDNLSKQKGDRRYRALIENSSAGIVVVSKSGQINFASTAGRRLLDTAGQTKDVFQAIHPKDRAAFISTVQSAASHGGRASGLECRILTKDGSELWIDVVAIDMTREPAIEGIVIYARNVTEKKMTDRDLRHRVLHDELTGISNHALMRERVDHALLMRRNDGNTAALLYLDLNDFRELNESYGTEFGDEVLKVIAFRIDNFVRGHDTAARMQKDRFAVLLQDVASQEDVDAIARRLLKVLQMPLDFNGKEVLPSARVGVCLVQPDYDSLIFMRNAEVALRESKGSPDKIAYFSETMTITAVERMDLRRELTIAIEEDQFLPHYQPILNLETGALTGFEALIRWEHPKRGLVSPGAFIPLAEESGLISPIGAIILYKACRQLNIWKSQRPDLELSMNINVADRQLKDPNFVQTLTRVLQETNTAPSSLVLELTETDAIGEAEIRSRLIQLHDFGVGLAADDFGNGFATFGVLQELPFTLAKIDRSLLNGLEGNYQRTTSQLKNVIDLAHAANLKVAAEGIENEEQKALLRSLDCDMGQGYFLGRPMTSTDATEVVTNSPALVTD